LFQRNTTFIIALTVDILNYVND